MALELETFNRVKMSSVTLWKQPPKSENLLKIFASHKFIEFPKLKFISLHKLSSKDSLLFCIWLSPEGSYYFLFCCLMKIANICVCCCLLKIAGISIFLEDICYLYIFLKVASIYIFCCLLKIASVSIFCCLLKIASVSIFFAVSWR